MKRMIPIAVVVAFALHTVSCQTTYDAQGNRRQSVNTTAVVAGVAAVALIGLALASKKNDYNENSYCRYCGSNCRHGRYCNRYSSYNRYNSYSYDHGCSSCQGSYCYH